MTIIHLHLQQVQWWHLLLVPLPQVQWWQLLLVQLLP
jgi:hypothetical protein